MLPVRRLYTIVLLAGAGGFAWLGYSLLSHRPLGGGVCLIKQVTGVPCPSCGTTRAIDALLHGHFTESVLLNPFGLLVFSAMALFPLWVLADLLTGNNSFFYFYSRAEKLLRRKYIAIPLAVLVLLNWIWNIFKGL
ncbi:MAG: hypothetical protein ABS46_04335 [Cytophagaceae bacterium SCN 52-12]|nr:MAG: hypothetical protein ABS46_04335 [Cytophagaceae bacterium SCN 52-12]